MRLGGCLLYLAGGGIYQQTGNGRISGIYQHLVRTSGMLSGIYQQGDVTYCKSYPCQGGMIMSLVTMMVKR